MSQFNALRKHLAEIGSKGGKVRSAKQKAAFAKGRSLGGKTVSPKKIAHLRKIAKLRVARLAAAKKGKAEDAG